MPKIFNGSFVGSFPECGQAENADCGVVLEFSHRPETVPVGQPNIEIALRLDEEPMFESVEFFASHSITRALEHIGSPLRPSVEFSGTSAHGINENLGTYGEWEQAFDLMEEHHYHNPIVLTSAWNIGNVVYQGLKISRKRNYPLSPIVLSDLPTAFDDKSDQFWTRSKTKWRTLTYVRQIRLRLDGH